jgi:hypothetical protein
LIQSRLPTSFKERADSKGVPPYLLVSTKELEEFEGHGAEPLATKQMALVEAEARKYTVQIIGNLSARRMLNQWLIGACVVMGFGILIMCSALLVRSGSAQKNRGRSKRQQALNEGGASRSRR